MISYEDCGIVFEWSARPSAAAWAIACVPRNFKWRENWTYLMKFKVIKMSSADGESLIMSRTMMKNTMSRNGQREKRKTMARQSKLELDSVGATWMSPAGVMVSYDLDLQTRSRCWCTKILMYIIIHSCTVSCKWGQKWRCQSNDKDFYL